ncbi:hypothetical protein K7432_014520 [Basidiobolus ranarum]|uniref:Uncharacterized protein n=1 Tax=Basidiobolus ranarum TaxID=34480 RepID=A0ABR2WHG6_9FUNG
MDNWGIAGEPQRTLTLYRGLGLVGLLLSVLVITRCVGPPEAVVKEELVIEEKSKNSSEV